jgi:hypothetical protein
MLNNETERTVAPLVRAIGQPFKEKGEKPDWDDGRVDDTHGSGGSGKGRAGILDTLVESIDLDELKDPPLTDTHGGGGSGKG